MPRNIKFVSVSLHPELVSRANKFPGYSNPARIEWILKIAEELKTKKETLEYSLNYDELVEYVIAQSKTQDREKVLGLIVGLLREFI